MADYKAPLRDMRFVLNEVFEVATTWAQLPALADTVDAETVWHWERIATEIVLPFEFFPDGWELADD